MGNRSAQDRAIELVAALERTGREVKSAYLNKQEIRVDLVTSDDDGRTELDRIMDNLEPYDPKKYRRKKYGE